MKSPAALLPFVLALVGCASAPPSPANAPASPPAPEDKAATAPPPPAPAAEEKPEEPTKSAAEMWAEKKSREDAAADTSRASSDGAAAADPLAVGSAMESAVKTKIELTPARELRPKTLRDLNEGVKIVEKAGSFEEAVQQLMKRLGKPTWIENGKKRVWVVKDGAQCHRLVLDGDGAVESETVPANEWRMLSALSQQNACTGAVQDGVPGMKH